MNAVPDELELVREFVNTADVGSGSDELDSPPALVAWLAQRDLIERGAEASEKDLERTRALREALRAFLYVNSGGELDLEAPKVLDAAAVRAGLRLHFCADGEAGLMSCAEGVDGAHGRLLTIVAEAMQAGSWARLKACRSDDCRWAFFDGSKNHSRAWCSMAVCGNRAKARAFRERQAGA
ncbi:MAG: CGNR zinc finger domain-containing protein [Gaiellaceae bacterium]